MSFLTGRTRTVDNSPRDTRETRRNIGNFINNDAYGGINRIFAGAGMPEQDAFMAQILAPYEAMFTRQRELAFADARESAGNLTGSGYGNYLGQAAADTALAQGAQMADIRQRITQQNAQNFLNLVMGFQNSGMPLQQQYQPGFLDYALGGVTAAAPFLGPMLANRRSSGGGNNRPNGGIP